MTSSTAPQPRWRPPTSIEVGAVIAYRSAPPASGAVLPDERLRRKIERILEAPPVDEPGLDPKQQFTRRLYRMCRKFFELPLPPADLAGIVAWLMLNTIDQSGGACAAGEVATAIWLRKWNESGDRQRRPFEDWISEKVDLAGTVVPPVRNWSTRLGGSDRPLQWPGITTMDEGDEGLVTIYVICRVAQRCADGLQGSVLAEADEIARGLSAAARALGYAGAIRIVHLGALVAEQSRPPEEWAALVQWHLPRADAYIVLEPLAFGGGYEVASRRRDAGSVLVVRQRDEVTARSLLLDAFTNEPGVCSVELAGWDGLAAAVAAWTYDEFEMILSAKRRRLNQETIFLAQQLVLLDLVLTASPAAILSALAYAAIRPGELRYALSCVEGFVALNGPRLLRFIDALRDPLTSPAPRRIRPKQKPEPLNLHALDGAAASEGWSADYREHVLASARAQLTQMNRFSLQTEPQWIDFEKGL